MTEDLGEIPRLDDGWSLGDEVVTADGVEFVLGLHGGSTSKRFALVKEITLLERYRALDPSVTGSRVFELGISQGGSAAWMTLELRPELLVTVDRSDQPAAALVDLIRERDLGARLRPHWSVDQADKGRLDAIARSELGDAPLDLVIDDASHLYQPTRASFEVLFPRLRSGGLYIIEDWNWLHREAAFWREYLRDESAPDYEDRVRLLLPGLTDEAMIEARETPLSRMAVEMMLVASVPGPIITEVTVNEFWITIRRGPADLDPATFSLDEIVMDDLGLLPPLPGRP